MTFDKNSREGLDYLSMIVIHHLYVLQLARDQHEGRNVGLKLPHQGVTSANSASVTFFLFGR